MVYIRIIYYLNFWLLLLLLIGWYIFVSHCSNYYPNSYTPSQPKANTNPNANPDGQAISHANIKADSTTYSCSHPSTHTNAKVRIRYMERSIIIPSLDFFRIIHHPVIVKFAFEIQLLTIIFVHVHLVPISKSPTRRPTPKPSRPPTNNPTPLPTPAPTLQPTPRPTFRPTPAPTHRP